MKSERDLDIRADFEHLMVKHNLECVIASDKKYTYMELLFCDDSYKRRLTQIGCLLIVEMGKGILPPSIYQMIAKLHGFGLRTIRDTEWKFGDE